MEITVKEICEKFWDIEEKYELNHIMIQGTYPWQLIRVYLYYEIARKLGIFESAQQASISKTDKIKSLTPFVKNSLLYNPGSGKEKDVLIFDHPRKVMFKGEYQDIYSYFLPQALDDFNKSYELIETPYLNKHYTNRKKKKDKNGKKYIKYNDKILLESYIHKNKNRNKVPYTQEELDKINLMEKAVENTFSDINQGFIITIDLFRIIEDHILNFQYEYEKYCEIFEKKKPQKIFVVVAYENKAVVAAAKTKGIEVIELQHGTISKYHLGYSYPKRTMLKNGRVTEIAYFPHKILTFGDYWKNACPYPIAYHNLITMGFPYFEENAREYYLMRLNKKNTTRILCISQGVIGKYLSEFAYELTLSLLGQNKLEDASIITNNPKDELYNYEWNIEKIEEFEEKVKLGTITDEEIDKLAKLKRTEIIKDNEFNEKEKYEIIYKLHPGEYETWRENYPYLLKALELNKHRSIVDFKVIDDNTTPLYELFATSEYQIGAFSTAIYEGLSFNCKTFIIDAPGIEYLDDLIKSKIVKKVSDVEEVSEEIKNKNSEEFQRTINRNYFFRNYDRTVYFEVFKGY